MKIWRPYTQEALSLPAIKVKKAKGCYLYLEDGSKLIDCISSWWLNIHGHGIDEISDAIKNQATKLEQIVFADFIHEAGEELVELISKILPKQLDHYFFSDDGSTAVEVAIKMALGYWKNLGETQKQTFIAFEGAYHGDTFGAMSVSSRSIFTRTFEKILFNVEFVPFPKVTLDPNLHEQAESKVLTLIEKLLSQNSSIAGVIIEPLVQGAGGMKMCSVNFLKKLEHLIKQHDNLLICDEVMTGFGRTGEWFGSTKAEICPDIICLSKGITGGVIPMGLTVAKEKIYNSFNSGSFDNTLFHGHSYTGNALACSAAIASLKLFAKNGERFRDLESLYKKYLDLYLADMKQIVDARICGAIFAFEFTPNNHLNKNYGNALGLQIKADLINEGVYLRPLGNTFYLMPPYCIEESEIEFVFKKLKKVLNSHLS